ncbi:MAG: energy-coupling factor transporter transmembrane component T [Candidatus Omnitrophica bacterium]|nr:energy-coupling factor transporter transmembrane component T [Candidatus Omnitrophota bacterium]
MRHAFIDNYSDLNTPLHRLNIKAKIIGVFIFLLIVIFTPIRFAPLFIFYGLMVLVLIRLSKVPLGFIVKRILELLPFIIIISLSGLFRKQGLLIFFNCTVKALLALLLVIILSSTTKFQGLLEALKQMHLPKLFILLLAFMYRYSFLLEDQFLRTMRAFESRNINQKNNFGKVRILSNILGVIFILTFERAERLYLAMCARGYDYEKGN